MRQTLARLGMLCVLGSVAACATKPESRPLASEETPECMNYRSMMTAPMEPAAMKRLQEACERSRMNH